MIEIVNQKYIPVTLHVDGETKIVEGRGKGQDNRVKLNVDSIEHLPAHVKDLIEAGYLTAKKISKAAVEKVEKVVSEVINEVESKKK